MEVRVIRGENQIGGSIIEVASETTRLVLDVGSELGEETPIAPPVEGLFQGKAVYDGVLVSHYHGDHFGLAGQVVEGIPLFVGEKAYAVYKAQQTYTKGPIVEGMHTFAPNERFTIGDIRITPYLCDHSAFDSYMFLLEAEGEKVLYTGDFRSNGRKNFDWLLSRLPKVDKLIIEGTTLTGSHAVAKTEAELEEEAVRMVREVPGKPVFVCMAATNIDRIVTFFRVAQQTNRTFLEDTYAATITSAIGETIPNPSFRNVKVFLTHPKYHEILQHFPESKIGRERIARTDFVMMVRSSMTSYLEKLADEMDFTGGILFYSLWGGYKKDEYTANFLKRMDELGLRVVDLHTSGHADETAIKKLIDKTEPKEIFPVHTENAAWFDRFRAAGLPPRPQAIRHSL